MLAYGSYNQLQLMNKQYAFMREHEGKRVITVLNVEGAPFTFNLNIGGNFTNIFTGEKADLNHPLNLPPYSSAVFAEDYEVKAEQHTERPQAEEKKQEEQHTEEKHQEEQHIEEKHQEELPKEEKCVQEETHAEEQHFEEHSQSADELQCEINVKNFAAWLIDTYTKLQRIITSNEPKKEAEYQLRAAAEKLKAMGVDTSKLDK